MTSVVEKRLGALPVPAEFLRRLDVAGIVDELCPSAASANLTHGQVIEALVANRLTSPMPLSGSVTGPGSGRWRRCSASNRPAQLPDVRRREPRVPGRSSRTTTGPSDHAAVITTVVLGRADEE